MERTPRVKFVLFAAIFLSLAFASPAFAGDGDNLWDADGEEIGNGGLHAIASDEAGGAFIAWAGGGIFVAARGRHRNSPMGERRPTV